MRWLGRREHDSAEITVVIRRLPDPTDLSAAVAAAEAAGVGVVVVEDDEPIEVGTPFWMWQTSDDELTPDGPRRLLAALGSSDFAAGRRRVHRRGARPPGPSSSMDLFPTGKVFRTGVFPSGVPPEPAALVSATRAVIEDPVIDEHDRDSALPLEQQRRFAIPDVADVVALVAARPSLRSAAAVDLLPDGARASVGAGAAYLAALRPLADELDGDDPLVAAVRSGNLDEVGGVLADREDEAFSTPAKRAFADPPPIVPRRVVLESFHGRAISDNPLAIARALDRRYDDLELVWVVDTDDVVVPTGWGGVRRGSTEHGLALATSQVVIQNAAAPAWFAKRPGQIHLQTWHGTPLKRIGEDRGPGDFATWKHRRMVAAQAASWDGLISPSPYCSMIFRSAFRFDGPMWEVGYPRNDVLTAPPIGVRDGVRRSLGLEPRDRAVLYAPTWREYLGRRDNKPLYLDSEQLVAELPEAVVLVRGHYNATREPLAYDGRSRVVDVTRYPDIADLYLAADALVTDYSSVMFDFAITDKPILLLTPDLAQYRDVERGFYFPLEERAPGPLVPDTAGVIAALAAEDTHAPARAAFRAEFAPWDDGLAADRVVDRIADLARW